jgi:DNA-binding Xre family transcriptional regulator
MFMVSRVVSAAQEAAKFGAAVENAVSQLAAVEGILLSVLQRVCCHYSCNVSPTLTLSEHHNNRLSSTNLKRR